MNSRTNLLTTDRARSGRLSFPVAIVAAFFLGAAGAKDARACALESAIDFKAFQISHRGVISVAMATRKAIEAGLLSALPEDPADRHRTLSRIGRQAAAHMDSLARLERSGSPVSVLLTQTGAWMRFNDPIFGARYHIAPPRPTELAILLPDTAYAGLLSGTLSVEDLVRLEVLQTFGDGDAVHAINAFSNAVQAEVRRPRSIEAWTRQ